MGPWFQPLTTHERLRRHRRARYQVSLTDRRLEVSRCRRRDALRGDLIGERVGALMAPIPHQYARQTRVQSQVCVDQVGSQCSGANHEHCCGTLAKQEACAKRRIGGSLAERQGLAFDGECWDACFTVK